MYRWIDSNYIQIIARMERYQLEKLIPRMCDRTNLFTWVGIV